MAENFYTMLTIVGKNKLSSSAVSGSKVNFKTLKVGDGKGAYYEPSENQTSLVNKVWEGNISSISIDENNSNWIVVETVIPASDGGFFIREAGIFDEDGDMIAISKLAETYKPVVAEGSTKDLVIRIVLEVLNVDTVTIKIDPNVVAATKSDVQVLDAKVQDVSAQLSDLAKNISNDTVLAQTVSYGMNNKITNSSEISNIPKFTIQGKTLINLLGKDGNCEDLSKWGLWQATGALDSTNKVFGSNGFKLTLTSTVGTLNKYLGAPNDLDITKYYLVSAYLKNGNATSVKLEKDGQGGGIDVATVAVTDTTKFTRVGIVVKPTDSASSNYIEITINGASGQYAYVDGIMVNEITATEYALGADALLSKYPYVDSYAYLQNPYIEVRHDNLVRNGNGEEGVAWWNQQGTPSQVIENGYFKFTDDDVNVNEGLYQYIPVKQGNTYSGRAIIKAGTCNAKFTILEVDDFGNQIQATRKDYITSNITDTEATLTITVSNNISKLGVFILCDGGTGTAYFKEIMLVECKAAPTEYKSCRVERVALGTKLTSDDSITYENGKVTGLINWKHKTLYGKDYDWAFSTDFTGYKQVAVQIPSDDNGISNSQIAIKYDGKIMSNRVDTSWTGSDQCAFNMPWNYDFQLAVADSDTGWTETINPNNDEVKAFMNGWRAMNTANNRYTSWININVPYVYTDTTCRPQGTFSTLTVATSGTTSVTVADASMFVVGDNIAVSGNPQTTVSSISGNTLILAVAQPSAPIGTVVFRLDNGTTDVRILNYCKSNIAPNYEGYQLHYKLANPESITDDNCHIYGDIPKFDVGDNYLYLDSGMVLGEINVPWYNSYDTRYYMNDIGGSLFKNKCDWVLNIYKNGQYNTYVWTIYQSNTNTSNGYGKANMLTNTNNFDTNATYTVDYKILATQSPQIGSIGCSYSQDISIAINNLQEDVNNKQEHDSILDEIVDLSLYEKQVMPPWRIVPYIYNGTQLDLEIDMVFFPKKTTPMITINSLDIYTNGGYVTNKFFLNRITLSNNIIQIRYSTTDATTINNIKSYGVQVATLTVIADCRGRV